MRKNDDVVGSPPKRRPEPLTPPPPTFPPTPSPSALPISPHILPSQFNEVKKGGLPPTGYTLDTGKTISPDMTLRHLVVETSEDMRRDGGAKTPLPKLIENVREKYTLWLENKLETTLWEAKKGGDQDNKATVTRGNVANRGRANAPPGVRTDSRDDNG